LPKYNLSTERCACRSAKDGREEEKALAAADGTTDSVANGRTGNLAEAQELRERALEALKGSGSGPVNATVGDPMEEDAGAEAEPNGEIPLSPVEASNHCRKLNLHGLSARFVKKLRK
jgi:hypothetical protein